MKGEVTERILKRLEQAQAHAPELRFGQLVAIISPHLPQTRRAFRNGTLKTLISLRRSTDLLPILCGVARAAPKQPLRPHTCLFPSHSSSAPFGFEDRSLHVRCFLYDPA